MLDASIIQGLKPIQVEPQANALARIMQLQAAQRQNELGGLQLEDQRQSLAERSGLRNYLAGNPNLDTPEGQSGLYQASPTGAAAILKGKADIGKSNAEMQQAQAATQAKQFETAHAQAKAALDLISGSTDQASYDRALQIGKQIGLNPQAPAQFDPAFVASARQQAMTQVQRIEQEARNRGLDLTQRGQDMTAQTAAAGQRVTMRGQDLTNDTSRANNAANINKDLLVAGVQPGGGLDDNAERTAQAIAKGQLQPPSGMALLNPKNQRILGRVMEINPDYDSTTMTAKKAAATAFTSGTLGNALRSVSTANAHLDQLGELADALNNGNTQIVNKVTNFFQAQTGDPSVTNFNAIKNVVGQEVVKAIVAGGGGVGEREEAAKAFSAASSPAQLKGVIQHYRMVMGAQADNLMAQRDAAGLPRSTLPNYNQNPAADQSLHDQADAILRGGK